MSESIDMDQVNRLGFEAWADNMIANELGWLPSEGVNQITYEKHGAEMTVTFYEKHTQYVVRAYIPGEGFKCHERIVKQ
jgi:hypothetical protein